MESHPEVAKTKGDFHASGEATQSIKA